MDDRSGRLYEFTCAVRIEASTIEGCGGEKASLNEDGALGLISLGCVYRRGSLDRHLIPIRYFPFRPAKSEAFQGGLREINRCGDEILVVWHERQASAGSLSK